MAGLAGATGGATGAIRAGRAYVEAFLDANPLDRGLRSIRNKFQALGQSLQNIGLKSIMAGVGLATPLAAATAITIQFDDAIRAAGAVAEATDAQLAGLTETAKQLGRTTSFSAREVADSMIELGTRGFNPEQIEGSIGAVLNLARAARTTTTTAATGIGQAIKAFGLSANDAVKVADLYTAAANKSAVSVESLIETMSYVGPVARDLGISLTDTLAFAGALGDVGIAGSEAGTSLRRLNLIAASQPELFEAIGVTTKDAGGNLRSLVDILADVDNATRGMGNADRAKVFSDIFGILGVTGASTLSRSRASVAELRSALTDSAGIADRTARQMDGGIGGAWRRFKGAVEGAAIAIGDALAPSLLKVGEWLGYISNSVINFINQNREVVVVVAAVAAGLIAGGVALVAIGLAFKVVAAAVGAVIFILGTLKALVVALFSPAGLIAAGIAGLVYAWATLTDSGKETVSELKQTFSDIGDTARETWGGIVNAIKAGDLKLAFDVALAGIKLAWAQMVEFLSIKWAQFKGGFQKSLEETRTSIAEGVIAAPIAFFIEQTQGRDAAAQWAKGIGDNLDEMARHANRSIDSATAAAIQNAQAATRTAREEFERLTAQARAAAEAANANRNSNILPGTAFQGALGFAAIGGKGQPANPSQGLPTTRQLFDATAGGFASTNLRGQFGYSEETFQKRALTAAEQTAKNTEEAAKELGRLAFSLRWH